jgi:MSHA biogenesis protein MshJ
LNAPFQAIAAKFAALKQRERWMVFMAGMAVIYAVLNVVALSPALKKQQLLTAEMTQSQSQLSDMQQQIFTLKQNPVLDIDRENQQKIAALNLKVQAQNQELALLQKGLVTPERMPALLKSLIRSDAQLQLVGIKTQEPTQYSFQKNAALQPQGLSPQNIPAEAGYSYVKPNTGAASSGVAQEAHAVIYKHGLALTLSGNYLDLLHYAEALQGLSNQVLWDNAVLITKEYPVSELTVTVYTLSLDKTWLSI